MKKILVLVAIKFLLLLGISYFVKSHFTSINNFSFPDELTSYGAPNFMAAFANFDGIHYIKIARGEYYEFSQVFFPFFPLLIMLGSQVISSHLVTGLLISNVCFTLGLYFLLKLLEDLKFKERWWVIFFIATFPTSFFFQTIYTESLFFMFTMIFFYSLKRNKMYTAAIVGFFASLTRFIGFFLIVPLLIHLAVNKKNKPRDYLIGLLPGLGC